MRGVGAICWPVDETAPCEVAVVASLPPEGAQVVVTRALVTVPKCRDNGSGRKLSSPPRSRHWHRENGFQGHGGVTATHCTGETITPFLFAVIRV